MAKYILSEPQKYLILASYCDQNPECSDEKPCEACLEMCNVATIPAGTEVDVLGGFEFIRGGFMKAYQVKTIWSGYSRGTSTYIVHANSPEEAGELWYEGERIEHKVVRDDTENEIDVIEEA